jgi:hypothetical protein
LCLESYPTLLSSLPAFFGLHLGGPADQTVAVLQQLLNSCIRLLGHHVQHVLNPLLILLLKEQGWLLTALLEEQEGRLTLLAHHLLLLELLLAEKHLRLQQALRLQLLKQWRLQHARP